MPDQKLDPNLLQLLRCPCPAHGELTHDTDNDELICRECRRAFPVRDGIPVMLLDEAREPGD